MELRTPLWQPLVKLLESVSHCNPTFTAALKISLSISKAEEKTIIEISIVINFFFMVLGH